MRVLVFFAEPEASAGPQGRVMPGRALWDRPHTSQQYFWALPGEAWTHGSFCSLLFSSSGPPQFPKLPAVAPLDCSDLAQGLV